MTVDEIEADGFEVNAKIASLLEGDTSKSTAQSMAKTIDGLADVFDILKPDLVVILGDRYEALAAAAAAVAFNIPIAHLHGGETTEGAIDDKFRHAITQLSDYHFASTAQYADRIISMGAKPERVFHSGAPGAEVKEDSDPALAEKFYDKTGILPGEPFILLAMHPVTKASDNGKEEVKATLEALRAFVRQGYKILSTMPNSDPGNEEVANLFEAFSGDGVIKIKSLGSKLFHYAMEQASAMAGNSSAALIEAPSHRLPAVNIGIRQKGRAHGMTVLDSPAIKSRIEQTLQAALSLEMKSVVMGLPISSLNPYWKEDSANFIASKLLDIINKDNI